MHVICLPTDHPGEQHRVATGCCRSRSQSGDAKPPRRGYRHAQPACAIGRTYRLRTQDVIVIDPFAPVSVVVVSPEEAESGVAELWQNGRLLGTTQEQDSRILLRFTPPAEGDTIEVGALVLREALEEARQRLGDL